MRASKGSSLSVVKLADPITEFNPMDEQIQLVLTVRFVQIRLRHLLLECHGRASLVTETLIGADADATSLVT